MTKIQHEMDPRGLFDHGFHGFTQRANVRFLQDLLVRKGDDCRLIFILNADTRLNGSHNDLRIAFYRHEAILRDPDGPVKPFTRRSGPRDENTDISADRRAFLDKLWIFTDKTLAI